MEAAAGRMQSFMQELAGNSERQMEESGRAATAKWIAELERRTRRIRPSDLSSKCRSGARGPSTHASRTGERAARGFR